MAFIVIPERPFLYEEWRSSFATKVERPPASRGAPDGVIVLLRGMTFQVEVGDITVNVP
jgi:hypothetical protein